MTGSKAGTAKHRKAWWMLVLATPCWGISFPLAKTLWAVQLPLASGVSNWFLSSVSILLRFLTAGLLLALVCAPKLRGVTRKEWFQGIGLGAMGAGGIVLQMDALNYAPASTVAFLTQCYCVIIPVYKALVHRQRPSKKLVVSCLMVLIGVELLSGFSWSEFTLGRGEFETLLASLFFTGQILWLERKTFEKNNSLRVSVLMFLMTAASMFFVALFWFPGWTPAFHAYSSPAVLAILGALTLICTLVAYTLMTFYQPHIDASEAGLIYCVEPLFASVFALFLPAIFSKLVGVNYLNERATWNLALGGGLITAANVLIQLRSKVRSETF